MSNITGFIYRNFIKRILFLFPADYVHTLLLKVGKTLGKSKFAKNLLKNMWSYQDEKLAQIVCDLTFQNPIGLSAGFDYNADLVNIIPDIGFGFSTIGTLTSEAYEGNPAPMLGRLPKSRSLLVNKGFKNEGVKKVLSTMSGEKTGAVKGVSIGVTNKSYDTFEAMIDNLVSGFREAEAFSNFDYYELNISCPNLHNVKSLTNELASPEGINHALQRINTIGIKRPIFIKMPIERSNQEMSKLIDAIKPFSFVYGLIFSNLVKDRTNKAFDRCEVDNAGVGNFSGKPVEDQSNILIRFAYKLYGERFIIIGTGGVFNAEDAYIKIKSGATLVQLITGMVYQGPQVIGDINRGIAELLAHDGYTHISQAIGKDVKFLK